MNSEINLQESIMALMHSFKMSIREAINANELGLSALHVRILNIVQANQNQACTANTAVSYMKRDKAQIARLIKELINLNFIEKKPNPEDKRSQLLILTSDGKALMSKIAATEKLIQQQLKQGLTEEEVATFNRIAKVMSHNLNKARE